MISEFTTSGPSSAANGGKYTCIYLKELLNCPQRNNEIRISLYYTLCFYFPYLPLLAQPVTIFVYGPARYLHYFR